MKKHWTNSILLKNYKLSKRNEILKIWFLNKIGTCTFICFKNIKKTIFLKILTADNPSGVTNLPNLNVGCIMCPSKQMTNEPQAKKSKKYSCRSQTVTSNLYNNYWAHCIWKWFLLIIIKLKPYNRWIVFNIYNIVIIKLFSREFNKFIIIKLYYN